MHCPWSCAPPQPYKPEVVQRVVRIGGKINELQEHETPVGTVPIRDEHPCIVLDVNRA